MRAAAERKIAIHTGESTMRVNSVLAAIALVTTALPSGGADGNTPVATPRQKTLVFVGTVFSISKGGSDLKPWIVRIEIQKVVTGDLSGGWFEFGVHSPSRSGLEEGHSYTIKAVWDGKGYEVDENRWRRRTINSISVSDVPWKLDNEVLQVDDHFGRFVPSVAHR